MKKLAATIFFESTALLLLGLIVVMSASSAYSEFKFDSVYHLFNSHLFKVLFGFGLMVLFSFIPYEIYKDYSKPAIILTTIILFLTLFLAPTVKGAGRWISLGLFTFQPADVARLILVIHLAALLESKRNFISDFKNGFIYLFIWVVIVCGLILIQPNISNAILLAFISIILLYVGGAKLTHIIASSFGCLLAGGTGAMIFSHSRERIFAFINNLSNGGDLNLQVKQALLGLGSGGIFGVGIGHGKQSNLFLPEAYGDFIFAVMGEELGFIGAIVIISSFLALFLVGIVIAKKTKDRFGQLLAFGISFSIILYAFINIAVSTGLLPTTGLPLPFISYGGTSMTFLCISIGILINIAISNSADRKSNIEVVSNSNDRV
ncbi:MAG: cell division protein [Ignavibacteria bacterium GWC2_36_12]|nr:MAG: cell division protein [Ignavibacteria bacterium GWC2_36_12]